MPEPTQELVKWIIPLFITNGVLIVGSILGWIWQGRKTKREVQNMQVDTGGQAISSIADALKIANDAAKQVQEVRDDMGIMQRKHNREIDGLHAEIDELSYELKVSNAKYDNVKEWAERLVKQLRGCEQIPVPMKQFVIPERD